MNGNPQTVPTPSPTHSAGGLRRSVVITNPQGLHLRPATSFAKLARQFESQIVLRREDRAVNGKSQVELILLAAEPGAELILEIDGPDAEVAMPLLAELLGRENGDEDVDAK